MSPDEENLSSAIRKTIFLVVLFTFVGLPAFGGPLVFTFSSTVDASGLGLSPSSPLQIKYSYDPNLAPFAGSNAVYPMDFIVSVGGFTLQGHGVLGVVIQPTYQQVELNAANFVTYASGYDGAITGNINGATYSDLDLNIIDDSAPLDMLSSTALPASSLFITRANFIQFEASNGNANSAAHILKQFGPTEFTFTADATPEPGTAASFLLGAIGLIVLRRRQRM